MRERARRFGVLGEGASALPGDDDLARLDLPPREQPAELDADVSLDPIRQLRELRRASLGGVVRGDSVGRGLCPAAQDFDVLLCPDELQHLLALPSCPIIAQLAEGFEQLLCAPRHQHNKDSLGPARTAKRGRTEKLGTELGKHIDTEASGPAW